LIESKHNVMKNAEVADCRAIKNLGLMGCFTTLHRLYIIIAY
jgi:hypothetical protein